MIPKKRVCAAVDCDVEYESFPQGRRSVYGRWCSSACYQWNRRHPGEPRLAPEMVKCDNCIATFPRQGLKRFCSPLCSDLAHGLRVYGPKGDVVECAVCNQRKAIPWGVNTKTCSPECRRVWEQRKTDAWRAANPEKFREQERRRESKPERLARKAQYMRVRREMETGICRDPAIRTQVYMQAAGCCALCATVVPRDVMTLDHIVAIACGGSDTIENLQLAHFSCNARKGAREMVVA